MLMCTCNMREPLCLCVHARVGMIVPMCALYTCAGSQSCVPMHIGVSVPNTLHAHAGTKAFVSMYT